ncbi:response regulator [Candidatus Saccharibacteria bacterium]|nr:response regulator [Candidatus Saccharibacteria bacterium]
MSKPKPKTVYIIDDDELFTDCIELAVHKANKNLEIKKFKNAIVAMDELNDNLPDLIFLDILLPGADGFTFLNELTSYPDTAEIPVVMITSLNLPKTDLSIYGVRGILNKETMKPEEVIDYVHRLVK